MSNGPIPGWPPVRPNVEFEICGCANCHFSYGDDVDGMTCRRYPPQLIDASLFDVPHGYSQPQVIPTGWCGEYMPRNANDATS